ncbi:MAG: tetratricopeptide repeat protein [Pyrinomonadaceae bacterium]
MKQFFIFIGFVALVTGGFGCSGNSANSNEAANANVTESPFEGITDANAALAEGNRLLDENQTEMAIEALRQAVKLNPDLAEAYFKLGIAYALLEMQMEQSGTITEPPANTKEGRTKTNSEKAFGKAVDAYKKILEANPKDDVAQFNLGRTYAKLTQDEEAEKAFRQAVKLKPDDTEYQTELGAILIKLAKYHEAIDPLKKAIELDDQNARAQDLLEDAEAGRQRLDYVSPKKDASTSNSNKVFNSNANASVNANSNSAPKPPDANTKPKPEVTKKPTISSNKPR